MTHVRRLPLWLILVFACFASHLAAQSPIPVPPSQPPSDLITPINKDPISIDKALQKDPDTKQAGARNVILFIIDGLPASGLTLARQVLATGSDLLAFDRFPVVARVLNPAQDARVTDSAAAASAYATGRQGLLHRLSVDRDGKPIPTLWEVAKKKGLRVGLISDTRLTHATPAAFASHQNDRNTEYEIAPQMLEAGFDVLLSGGRKYFSPKTGSGSPDLVHYRPNSPGSGSGSQDLLEKAQGMGYRVLTTRAELNEAPSRPGKVLGLFHSSFLSYSYESGAKDEPSLKEMATAGLALLEASQDRFMLMIEAGKVDATLHAHDPAEFIAQMRIAEETLKTLQNYVAQHPETLLIMVPDHSTGGLIVTEQFDPLRFKALATSTTALAREFKGRPDELGAAFQARFPGITFSNEEVKSVAQHHQHYEFNAALGSLIYGKLGLLFIPFEHQITLDKTGGHVAEDLFLHAVGARSTLFNGVFRSWDLPGRIASAMSIDFP